MLNADDKTDIQEAAIQKSERIDEAHQNQASEQRTVEPLYLKSACAINSDHIPELMTLEEGWFVEFKERTPENSKIAKSISSFANSHGGLLVIGAKEEQKTRRLAGFAPMSREDADQCILRARDAVTAHVTPPTFFEVNAVELKEIEKDIDKRWIVVISTPKGRQGPYLHSNGCIYVRVGDAASPIQLTDSSQQERLWADSLHRKDRIRARVESLSDQFKQGTPSIHVVILADDGGVNSSHCKHSDFRKIALTKHAENSLPLFDQVQTLDTSFLARRTERQIKSSGVIWDYDYQRKLHFIQIPIATHIWSDGNFDNQADQYELPRLAKILRSRDITDSLMITNLLPSLYFLSVIIRKVQMLHQLEAYKGNLKINACVVDARATVPFLGTPAYFDEIENTNLPYVLRDIGFFRPIENALSWFNFSSEPTISEMESLIKIDIPVAFSVFSYIAQSMGISIDLTLGNIPEEGSDQENMAIAYMVSELINRSFSYTSQPNPKFNRRY